MAILTGQPELTLPLHVSSLTPSHHFRLRQQKEGKGQHWRKRSGRKANQILSGVSRDFEARCPSCCQPVLQTSTGTYRFFNYQQTHHHNYNIQEAAHINSSHIKPFSSQRSPCILLETAKAVFLQAGCSSRYPTNGVKALKDFYSYMQLYSKATLPMQSVPIVQPNITKWSR